MDGIIFFSISLVVGYIALYLLFYIVWGVSYVIHAMYLTAFAWLEKETITADDLRVDYIKYAPNLFWRPFMTVPLILWGVFFILLTTLEFFCKLFVIKVLPILRRWKFNMNYKLWPTWGNHDTLATFLNKLIGQK